MNPVDEFDPSTNTWTEKSFTPIELHHFQAVAVGDAIYMVGAMTGPYPKEKPLDKVVVYNPESDSFDFGHTIPKARRRGGAGAAYYNGKIYVVGGITNGHIDGSRPWLDEYDPQTGEWKVLADAPHARDHFHAVVLGDKLFAIAGRTTSRATNQVFDLTIAPVDVYDFSTQQWLPSSKTPRLPTPRAGNMALAWNGEIVVGGGETTRKTAHGEVEAYNPRTGQWRSWPSLQRGRHGSGFAIAGDYVYTASGSGNRGGSPELTSVERLRLPTGETGQ